MKILITIGLLSISFLCASDYSFVTPDRHVHLQGNYRPVGKAEFEKKRFKDTYLHYADSTDSLFLSHFLNDNNALSWQLGYSYLHLKWEENPRFKQTDFNYALASLGWISTAVDRWRWIVNAGVAVDGYDFDFGNSGVYSTYFWGRYHFDNCLGLHVGFFGYAGARNAYTLPIIGFDYHFGHWQLNAIFPIDLSLEYFFDKNWSVEVACASFGSPYKFPRRTHEGINGFQNGIVEVYSSGVELDLNYDCNQRFNPNPCNNWFNASLGIGWNFGGWLNVKNAHNHRGAYFKFDGAPYAEAEIALNF